MFAPALLLLALAAAPEESKVALTATVPVGQNLVLDGIPPIPASLADKVRRYTDYRMASFQDWHPTRREMLIATRFGESAQVHQVAMPLGARQQLTWFPGPIGRGDHVATYVPATAASMVVLKDKDGDENFQLHLVDLASRGVDLLTDGRSRNSTPRWNRTGTHFAFTSNRRNGKDFDLWLQSPKLNEAARLVAQLEGQWNVEDFSPDGKQVVMMQYLSANQTHLHTIDLASGERRHLTPAQEGEGPVRYDAARFSGDGKWLWVTGNRGAEFLQLRKLDLGSLQERVLTAGIPWDVDELAVSKDGRTALFSVNEDGFSRLFAIDARTLKPRPLRGIPDGVIGSLGWHANGRDVGFTLTSSQVPGDAFSVDVRTGKVTRWTQSEVGPIDPNAFAAAESITWKAKDGVTLHGLLYRPPAKFQGPRPLLVMHRGGPEAQSRPVFLATTNYYLNELGIAVIYLNVRGSPGYGKTYLAMDDGLKREAAYEDVGALLDWVATQSAFDASKVIFSGGSYGGHLSLITAYKYPDRLLANIDNVGMSSLLTFLANTADYRRDLRRAEYGDERIPEVKAFMERTAPLNNIDKMRRPMLVIQGKNDPRVPKSEADQIVASLKRRNIPVWYLVANDEGHGFQKKSNVELQLYVTALFLERLMSGGPEALRP